MDVAVAVVLAVIILIGSSYFFFRTNEDFISNMQMLRVGSDITAVLDADGTLDTLDSLQIKPGIDSLLPVNYDMRLTIYTNYSLQPVIAESGELSVNKNFIVSGKRYFYALNNGRYYSSLAWYEVWPR